MRIETIKETIPIRIHIFDLMILLIKCIVIAFLKSEISEDKFPGHRLLKLATNV
jgi:hypothetical protein